MTKITFSEFGQGMPVIFLHGFGENKELWWQFSEHLSDKYRILLPDIPGFGDSPLTRDNFSLKDIAEDIHEWLEEIDVKECVMIGHSMGGYITLAFAKKYPDMLKGLGLFHSSVFADSSEKKEVRTKTIEFVEKNGVNPFMENFVPNLFYKERQDVLKEIIQRQIEVGKKTPKESVVKYQAAMRDREDSTEFIKNFDKPVLLIAGVKDQSVPFEKNEEQADMLKKPTIHFLNDTAHMGMFEREKEALTFVESFLNGIK